MWAYAYTVVNAIGDCPYKEYQKANEALTVYEIKNTSLCTVVGS